jgi:hypothetical protein
MKTLGRPVLLALAALTIARVPEAAVPTLGTDELKPGQKAIVKTVFQGQQIEEFEAEILGVLRGGRVDGDIILARATSGRAIQSGVAQGMSGSPTYVDGKLIGALSLGWSFSRDPVFGITPIHEMLEVLDLPTHPVPAGSVGPSGADPLSPGEEIRFGQFHWDEPSTPPAIGTSAAGRAALDWRVAPLPLPLACTGLHPAATDLVHRLFEPLGLAVLPGGKTGRPETPASLEPGAAVAVELMRGDLQLAAIGTLTYRDGDRLLIFGHPLFQSGEVRLPLATASITTVVASQLSSFKVGSSGLPVGVLTQDRRAAMAGRLGQAPRLLPLGVRVTTAGRAQQSFHFESVEDRAILPRLVALAAVNSLLESGGVGPNQTLRWTIRLHRRGALTLGLSDVTVGDTPTAELGAVLGAPIRFLANNPFSVLSLDSIEVEVRAEPGRELWTLRSARVLDAAVRPGSKVRLACDLERWRGGRETVMVELNVPREAPDGRYLLWIGGGAELSRFEATRLPGRYRPTSLDEAWRRLASYRASDRLYAAFVAQAPEVTREGLDYPELPTSALVLLAGSQAAGDESQRGDRAILDEIRRPVGGQLRGELQLEVDVDSQAP